MSLPEAIDAAFSATGPLSRAAPGYRFRSGQAALAKEIGQTLVERDKLIAEAGTGVGKTFAYLVPTLLQGGKTLISTATRHLQDQLFKKDLPRVKAALGVSADIALLKGRNNYICLHRLEHFQAEGRFQKAQEAHDFRAIVSFAASTTTGDIAECASVPENASIWSMATSTRENCLGQNCPRVKDCHVLMARKKAIEADIIVVNHHLFCADLALRDQAMADLLPLADHVVIDEAHALPDIATQFFGQSASTAMLVSIARDALALGLTHARDAASWPNLCGAIDRAAAEIRMMSPVESLPAQGRKIAWLTQSYAEKERWTASLNQAVTSLTQIENVLALNAERHVELAQLHSRVTDLLERLALFLAPEAESMVRWIDITRFSVTLHVTPYDIAERFRQELDRHARAWVFVSATLSVGGNFQHFQSRMGLADAKTFIADSPFDYAQQGLLLVPQSAPDPKATDMLAQLLAQPEIEHLLTQAQGGIFLLCTSLRSVEQGRKFALDLAQTHRDRLVLVQGDAPRHQLIEQFRAHGRALLVGSHSFWEGVDVPGRALSVVLIDKLPFAPPDDPVLEARARWIKQQGRDPFFSLQLPEAAIALKQGVGRLLRSETDRGLIVVGDRRLADTAYGRQILKSLPPFQRTRDCQVALDWLNELTSPMPEKASPTRE